MYFVHFVFLLVVLVLFSKDTNNGIVNNIIIMIIKTLFNEHGYLTSVNLP